MIEAAGEEPKALAITRFAWWFGSVAGLVVIILLVAGKWASAIGVAIGLSASQWATRQIRRTSSRTGVQRSRIAGARVMAVTNGTVGAVILFVGALIAGDLILAVTAAIGTMMISMATLLFVIGGSGLRTSVVGKSQNKQN
jgi:hypothetical protein